MLSDDRHFELVEGCAQEAQQLVQVLRFYDSALKVWHGGLPLFTNIQGEVCAQWYPHRGHQEPFQKYIQHLLSWKEFCHLINVPFYRIPSFPRLSELKEYSV